MTPERMEAVLVPKYTEAITFGVEALAALAVEDEQVEDEGEEAERPKKKAKKDSYARFPLPAVIGTKEFDLDDYCGLHIEGM
jgi:hypothetical protein